MMVLIFDTALSYCKILPSVNRGIKHENLIQLRQREPKARVTSSQGQSIGVDGLNVYNTPTRPRHREMKTYAELYSDV